MGEGEKAEEQFLIRSSVSKTPGREKPKQTVLHESRDPKYLF